MTKLDKGGLIILKKTSQDKTHHPLVETRTQDSNNKKMEKMKENDKVRHAATLDQIEYKKTRWPNTQERKRHREIHNRQSSSKGR